MACDDSVMVVTVSSALSNSATSSTTIAIDKVLFIVEDTSNDHDTFKIYLGNTAVITAGKELRFRIYPVKNPSSFKPLTTFSGYTSDISENKIESWSAISYATTLVGEFATTSTVKILDIKPPVD